MSDRREYPRYVVLTPNAVHHCGTLPEALGRRGEDGMIYEPLGASAIERVDLAAAAGSPWAAVVSPASNLGGEP